MRTIDHGDVLFADFRDFYLPLGERILAGDPEPVPGGTLTPGMALAMAGLAATGLAWELYVVATLLALLGTLGAGIGLLRAARPGGRGLRGREALAIGMGFLWAVPTLHALKWGQSSTFATCFALLAGLASVRGRGAWAAVCVGLAMTCKPWAVLAVAVLPGWRARSAALGLGAVFALGVPALLLGPGPTFDRALQLVDEVRRMTDQFAVDPNSQAAVHVGQRYLRVPAGERAALDLWLLPLGQLLALGWSVWVARRAAGQARSVPLALCAVPLLVPSAWPNDLQFAFVGLVLAVFVERGRRGRACAILGLVLLAAPWAWWLGWRWYGGLGLPLAAVLCLAGTAVGGGRTTARCAAEADREPGPS